MKVDLISRTEFNKLRQQVRDALDQASSHDPEHHERLVVLERQMQRLGAPEYRRVRKGKP